MCCCYRLLLALIVSLCLAGAASAADPLRRYPVDPTQISVAGISSGAFMANQLHVAHSADIMGIGVVAGGSFGCAVADTNESGVVALISIATGACMQAPNLLHPAEAYAERIRVFAAQGWIDPVENLARARLYAFTGQSDQVVSSESVRRGVAVYAALGLQAALFRDDDLPDPGAGHAWVTQSFGGDCELNTDPYINKCNYDQAKDILSTIYGPLKDKATQLSGHIVEFDQHEFVGDRDTKGNGLWGHRLSLRAWRVRGGFRALPIARCAARVPSIGTEAARYVLPPYRRERVGGYQQYHCALPASALGRGQRLQAAAAVRHL